MQHWGSLVVAGRIFSCGVELPVVACGISFPDRGLNSGTLHWKCSLSHWTTREVPGDLYLKLGYFTETELCFPGAVLREDLCVPWARVLGAHPIRWDGGHDQGVGGSPGPGSGVRLDHHVFVSLGPQPILGGKTCHGHLTE